MVFRLHTSEGRKIFHRERIIRALAQLKRAQTGKISKLMNEFAKADIEIEYKRMYPSYDLGLDHDQKNKEMLQDIKWASITQRALPDILKNLIGEGLVTKSESDVYQLTKAGQQEPILGELCGRMLLDSLLKSIPENTNTNEQQQFIGMAERLGVFMAYVLTRNLMFTRNQLRKQMARDKNEWLNQVINTDYLMDWFTNKFISKKNGRETTTYKNLMTILEQHSPEYYRKLVNAEMEFNKPLIKKNYEQIRKRVDNN